MFSDKPTDEVNVDHNGCMVVNNAIKNDCTQDETAVAKFPGKPSANVGKIGLSVCTEVYHSKYISNGMLKLLTTVWELSVFHKLLPTELFCRCHRSVITFVDLCSELKQTCL